eukprot:CAMPEP_0168421708 /NCGR_PEP_ID=MMETSP0228-20121227/33419_1 /TAXON_ID=133427 /ORGANISM="Protoceratium reticulatum, Strain CCCM 535 (=CCMP 1889)" /LENGTH=32 /DNA_ID= /DNA_START= /DNA_END= /DNA_ORIENTATION=
MFEVGAMPMSMKCLVIVVLLSVLFLVVDRWLQ